MRRRIFFCLPLEICSELIEPFICFLNVLRKAEENNKSFQFLDPALFPGIIVNISGQQH